MWTLSDSPTGDLYKPWRPAGDVRAGSIAAAACWGELDVSSERAVNSGSCVAYLDGELTALERSAPSRTWRAGRVPRRTDRHDEVTGLLRALPMLELRLT